MTAYGGRGVIMLVDLYIRPIVGLTSLHSVASPGFGAMRGMKQREDNWTVTLMQ